MATAPVDASRFIDGEMTFTELLPITDASCAMTLQSVDAITFAVLVLSSND